VIIDWSWCPQGIFCGVVLYLTFLFFLLWDSGCHGLRGYADRNERGVSEATREAGVSDDDIIGGEQGVGAAPGGVSVVAD
jgi:hypothetical protein